MPTTLDISTSQPDKEFPLAAPKVISVRSEVEEFGHSFRCPRCNRTYELYFIAGQLSRFSLDDGDPDSDWFEMKEDGTLYPDFVCRNVTETKGKKVKSCKFAATVRLR